MSIHNKNVVFMKNKFLISELDARHTNNKMGCRHRKMEISLLATKDDMLTEGGICKNCKTPFLARWRFYSGRKYWIGNKMGIVTFSDVVRCRHPDVEIIGGGMNDGMLIEKLRCVSCDKKQKAVWEFHSGTRYWKNADDIEVVGNEN